MVGEEGGFFGGGEVGVGLVFVVVVVVVEYFVYWWDVGVVFYVYWMFELFVEVF